MLRQTKLDIPSGNSPNNGMQANIGTLISEETDEEPLLMKS